MNPCKNLSICVTSFVKLEQKVFFKVFEMRNIQQSITWAKFAPHFLTLSIDLILRGVFFLNYSSFQKRHQFGNPYKQEYVSEWQKKFNSIEYDLRFDNEVQVEWHQRLVDLIDQARFQIDVFLVYYYTFRSERRSESQ